MEKHSRYGKGEALPLEKYVGRLARCGGERVEVVGYSGNGSADEPLLIIDASQVGGWDRSALEPSDVIFKDCEKYWYAGVDDLTE